MQAQCILQNTDEWSLYSSGIQPEPFFWPGWLQKKIIFYADVSEKSFHKKLGKSMNDSEVAELKKMSYHLCKDRTDWKLFGIFDGLRGSSIRRDRYISIFPYFIFAASSGRISEAGGETQAGYGYEAKREYSR
jgi:hypothetical protein